MGRPRKFDIEQALDTATRLFCERGYHSVSIADLTEALGILRGSLYAAFPDKHSLLLTALDRYRISQLDALRLRLNGPGLPVDCLRSVLLDWADQTSGPRGKQGCLIAVIAQELLPGDPEVAERISRHFQQMTALFEDALAGILPAGSAPAPLAAALVALLQGLRVVGKTGPSAFQTRQAMLTLHQLLTEQSTTSAARASAAGA
jgi:TetR/AcrR family transcriptional regulator, transcriptional repressor for nem operon